MLRLSWCVNIVTAVFCSSIGVVIDTERDIVVDNVPVITPNGDVVVSSLSLKVVLHLNC
jgi:hypothetical protein